MKIIAVNKKANFNYNIKDIYEVGIVLTGDEVKSVRSKQVSLNDAFAVINNGEISLLNCHIAPYSHAYIKHDNSRRSRKLLLHKNEITKILGDVSKKGVTMVPLKVYLNERGYVKLTLATAVHKKLYDKRQDLKDKDIKREALRVAKVRLR